MGENKYLPIITREESCKLAVNDICYVYRINRKLHFETDRGVKYSYGKIDDLEKYLGPDFYRCMSGFIVNITRITDMSHMYVYFDNGKSVRMGKETYVKVKQRFNAYMLRMLEQYEKEKEKQKEEEQKKKEDDDDEND